MRDGETIAREIDALAQKATPRPWTVKERLGRVTIEVELPCINGLAAWFALAEITNPDDAERGYTDGAIGDARSRGAFIVALVNAWPALRDARTSGAREFERSARELDAIAELVHWGPHLSVTLSGVVARIVEHNRELQAQCTSGAAEREALERKRGDERARADSNFESCERVKGLYSTAVNERDALQRERVALKEEVAELLANADADAFRLRQVASERDALAAAVDRLTRVAKAYSDVTLVPSAGDPMIGVPSCEEHGALIEAIATPPAEAQK